MDLIKYKTSIILPYFNEEKNLEYTFNLLQNQTHQPNEIIFIDSYSSDDSFNKLNLLIENKNYKKISIYNFKTNLKSPSECKNYGISKSNYDWLLFMDFELKFNKDWIQSQLTHQNQSNKNVVFGVANITGKNLFDRSCIFQTFGYKSNTPIIPSSLVHKSIFNDYGIFLPIRSTYDRVWISIIRKNQNIYSINYDLKIDYLNFAYSTGPFHLFIKTINLCLQTIFIKNYNSPYLYLFLLIIIILSNNINVYLSFLVLNIFIRGFYLPYIKNQKYYFKNYKLIPYHIITGLIIDISRFFGFTLSLLLRIFDRKIRLDSLIRK